MRRQLTPKSSTLLTNAGQPQEIPVGGAAITPPPADPLPAGAPPGTVKDETWWRKRMTAASETLTRDQAAAEALQSRINVLQRDVVNVDDPIRQGQLRQELQKTVEELGRAKKMVDDDRKAVLDIQDEARRANVPAGWIR